MEIPVSCNKDCGGGCPLTAEVKNGRIIKITDSAFKGPWMSGCSRGYNARRYASSPERLTIPMIRSGRSGSLVKASWNEALDYTAEKLTEIRETYGASSIMRLGGSGSCRGALHNTSTLTKRFLNLFGGFTDTTGSYSSAAVSYATPFVYGTTNAAVDSGSLMRSEFILLLGANIADLRFGCELYNRLKHLRKQGVPMVVVDPRRTQTVKGLDAEWIAIHPGTDAAFVASVIYDLTVNGGLDRDYIDLYCHGFDEYSEWLFEHPAKTPQWGASICGTSAENILKVAACYRKYKPAALVPGLSIQRNLGGEDAARSAMVLQSVTGNVGIPGGTSGANIWGPMPKPRCGRLATVSAGLSGQRAPQVRYVPVYTWPDVVLNDNEFPPVRAVYNCGGNYLVQGADSKKSARAFGALDFSVTHDLFMTPTAGASDVVFPVADFLERSDIVFPEGNFLLYSARAIGPPPGVKTDYEIFSLLAERLGFAEAFTEGREEAEWIDYFISNSDITEPEVFRKRGIWFGKDDSRISLADFIADPEGRPLDTPSGKIEISSAKFAEAGGSSIPVYREHCPPGKYRLVTPHQRERINSQPVGKKMKKPAEFLMNTGDGIGLGIGDGDRVRLSSETGELTIPVKFSESIISGTACLDCSYSNSLTSTEPALPSYGSRTHSTFVDIVPA